MIDKFIFVHILKCAGTTLRYSLFENKFKRKYLYDSTFKPKINNMVKNIEHPVIIEPQQYPKEYEKYDVLFGHFKYDKYLHLNRPMFSFIRHPVERMISQYFYHKTFYKRRGKNIDIIEFSKIWKNHISYVLGNPNQYEYIGVVEKFNESLNEMCNILGITTPKKIQSKRVDYNIRNVEKSVRNQIAKINSEDMELYENIITKSKSNT